MIRKNRLREWLRNRDGVYVMARCIYDIKWKDFIQLIKGYFEGSHDFTSVLITHNGKKYPNEKVYYIPFNSSINNMSNNKKVFHRTNTGFCASLRRTLDMLNFADFYGLTPVVEWGDASAYYDAGMDEITRNVFEYYFEPVSIIDYRDIQECRNVIVGHPAHGSFLMEHATNEDAYRIVPDEIKKLGYIYRKYVHLNDNTKKYIESSLNKISNQGTILAVHVRGTDFNQEWKNHPTVITPVEYLEKAKELYSSGRYEKVFLATEDKNALTLFQQEFKDKLLYYSDVFRTQNHIGPHETSSNRSLHYYKLGLEVLRDVYTLANCNSLLCGLSQVAFASRYVNFALNRMFDEVVVLNNGINEKDSAEASKTKKQMERRAVYLK